MSYPWLCKKHGSIWNESQIHRCFECEYDEACASAMTDSLAARLREMSVRMDMMSKNTIPSVLACADAARFLRLAATHIEQLEQAASAQPVTSAAVQAMNFHYVPAHQCHCSIFKTGTCDCEPSQIAIVQAAIGPAPKEEP